MPIVRPIARRSATVLATLGLAGWMLAMTALLDIVAIDEREGAAIYFGQRDGKFSTGVPVGGRTPTPYALVVGDVSGDGKPDIIIGNVEAQSMAYINDGSGRHFHVVRFGDNKGTVYGFAIADVNRD